MKTIGRLGLLLAAGCSLALVWMRVSGYDLPGCGEGSACGRLDESSYSSIPMPWGALPTSVLGAAYFIGMLVLSGGVTAGVRWLARAGILASLLFVVVAFREQLLCGYCLTAHLGNAIFWVTLELRRDKQSPRLAAGAGVFAVALLALMMLDLTRANQATQQQETQLQESLATITATQPATATIPAPLEPQRNPIVRGRWRLGPEQARVRIVMFIGYQCADCKRIDAEALQLARGNPDVSLAVRHFPLHPDCNESVSRAMQPNACWAARAAETAGWIAGDDGFFRMHEALFQRRGRFESTADLHAVIAEAGLEQSAFMQAFQDRNLRETFDALIAQDVEEGVSLGLFFTPMIFVNGVELKGWAAPRALSRTVQAVLDSDVPVASDSNDRPPRARGKYIADWREATPIRGLPAEEGISVGPQDAMVRVTIFGDYNDASTSQADAIVRAAVAERGDVRYTWRHFPLDTTCNPRSPVDRNKSCAKHEAAAALQVRDPEPFWALHTWLLGHLSVSGAALDSELAARQVTGALRSDPQAIDLLASDAAAWDAVQNQAKRANALHRKGLPTVIINDRIVPRWKRNGRPVLDEIIEAAARE